MLHLHQHCISLSRNSGHGLLFITISFWAIPTCFQDFRFHFYVVSVHKYNRYFSTFHKTYTEQTLCIRKREGGRKEMEWEDECEETLNPPPNMLLSKLEDRIHSAAFVLMKTKFRYSLVLKLLKFNR